MRKVPGYLLIAILIAASSGCQCCDALLRLEAWKNQTLFGCFCPCLYGCGQNGCPPAATCPPTGCPPTYGQSMVAPLSSQPIIAPSYSDSSYAAPVYSAPSYGQSYAAPYTDCAGATIVGSPVVDCSGATIVSSPVCQDGCGTGLGETTVIPGPALTPTPVPVLRPSDSLVPPATR